MVFMIDYVYLDSPSVTNTEGLEGVHYGVMFTIVKSTKTCILSTFFKEVVFLCPINKLLLLFFMFIIERSITQGFYCTVYFH